MKQLELGLPEPPPIVLLPLHWCACCDGVGCFDGSAPLDAPCVRCGGGTCDSCGLLYGMARGAA